MRRNAGYPAEIKWHAASDFAGRAMCGAETYRLVFGEDRKLPYYKTGAVSCERCRAALEKAGVL